MEGVLTGGLNLLVANRVPEKGVKRQALVASKFTYRFGLDPAPLYMRKS
jgi:hypothetical protein